MAESRKDGRTGNQLRPLACSRGLLHRADGSARFSQENTIVVAAVYGPKAVTGRRENSEHAVLQVLWQPKSGQSGNAEKEAEFVLRKTLEHIVLIAMHPNTIISIIIQVVNDDGALMACAINAACAALVDAGIPLSCLIASVSCAVTESGQILLDPIKQEEQELGAHACFVFPSRPLSICEEARPEFRDEPLEHGLITSITKGAMSVDDFLNCLERGRAASVKIVEFSRVGLERYQRS